jgi:hypothetical protein
MTPQEQRIFASLIGHVRTFQQPRDPELVDRLQQELGNSPDALYPLAEAAINVRAELEYTQSQLQQATAELNQLRAQAANAPHKSGNFFSNLFGSGTPTQQGFGQQPYPPQGYGQPQNYPGSAPAAPGQPVQSYQPVSAPPAYGQAQPYPQQGYPQQPYPQQGYPAQPYPPQPYAPQGYGQPQYGQPGGSTLGHIAQTAAGVVAGEMVFQGIESALHGGQHDRNFEQSSGPQTGHDSGGFYNPHSDASRSADAGNISAQSNDDASGTGDSFDALDQDTSDPSFDDSSSDDTSSDDSSSFDSGSDDSN